MIRRVWPCVFALASFACGDAAGDASSDGSGGSSSQRAAPAGTPGVASGSDYGGVRRVDIAELPAPIIDEETARRLFNGVRSGKRQKWDPLGLAVLKEDVTLTFNWPEHEGGKVTMRTNNLGFRRDTDTDPAKACVRVVIAGDSHTDGLVDNDESFVTLLETRLSARGGRCCECLNAGVGGNGPHNYLGMLRKTLPLQPDVFVAMLYAGNDFTDAVFVQDDFSGRKPRAMAWSDYGKPLEDAVKKYEQVSLIGNSFNQAYRYKHFPEEEALALSEVVAVFESMARLCREHGIRFLAGVIPTKVEVDEDDEQTIAAIMSDLGLTEADMAVNERLRVGAVAALRARGIAVLDPTGEMKASTTPYYWRRDHHLNVEGNVFLAERLLPEIAALVDAVAAGGAVGGAAQDGSADK